MAAVTARQSQRRLHRQTHAIQVRLLTIIQVYFTFITNSWQKLIIDEQTIIHIVWLYRPD